MLDRFAFSGTPEQGARQAMARFGAGATRVEFGTPHGLKGLATTAAKPSAKPDRAVATAPTRSAPRGTL